MTTPLSRRAVAMRLVILAGLAATVLGAVEGSAEQVTIRCSTDRLAIGSGDLTTWTLIDDPAAYRPEDIVLTQDHLDRMRLCWAPVGEDGRSPTDGGVRPVVAPRKLRMIDDQVLRYPIEIILPGWASLAGPSAPGPGTVLMWWHLGGGWGTSPVSMTLVAPAEPSVTAPIAMPVSAPIAYGLDASFDPLEVVALSGELRVRVTRIAASYDRPEVWRSAVIEWTRLPDGAKELTTVYSPFQAGVKIVEPLTTADAVATPMPHDLRFRVSEALRDPRTGVATPGRYRIRLAMGWKSIVPEESSTRPQLVTIRSLPQTIRVLAHDEPLLPHCPICGARLQDDAGERKDIRR